MDIEKAFQNYLKSHEQYLRSFGIADYIVDSISRTAFEAGIDAFNEELLRIEGIKINVGIRSNH
jgi:hypothetical protein